ncbi:floral homeotic protein DEFICIENS-like isoform X2 [Coffea arabica]|uniref:Floral homeotic protein DEFICIENS-like isoform X2 n=1 Tax=Coffea arabica TaxID=13443 RepID=A0ABM4VZU4_COFAR
MARGKIQIKRIENQTNRQVTYSKRRNGLFKKAHELTVLCDARVSIIMVSSTQKLHEYISPTATTKQLVDQYQKAVGVDLWSSHYEKMQEQLKKLKDVNRNLRKEIRQRMGESLNDLSYDELGFLMEDVDNSLRAIRERKLRNVEEIHRNLLLELDARGEDPHYGLVDNGGGDYNPVLGYPRVLALRFQPTQPNLHSGGGSSDLTTFALLE